MAGRTGDPIDKQYRVSIESTYNPIPRDDREKIIDNILTLIEMGHDKKQPLKSALEYAMKMIFRLFDFHQITVGLKNRTDGAYRYELFFGLRKELEDDMRKVKYNHDDMVSNEKFPFIKLGRFSELDPAEGIPEWERDWYKPYALNTKRQSADEFHEGDYIDVWMYSRDRELIGWFEIGDPMSGKLPSREQVRWIELIASVCSMIIVQKWADEDAGQTRASVRPGPARPR